LQIDNFIFPSKQKQSMKQILAAISLFISTAAYSQPTTDSLLVEGHYRTFQYVEPAKPLNNGNLLFIMHGSGGSSNDMVKRATQLQATAATEQLLIVYPDGYRHFWNECRKYSTAAANKEDINEQAFFTAMIDHFTKKFQLDKKKVYATGFSGGGHMAYKLGITMPDKIKAIAAVVANMPDSASCDCTLSGKALPVLIINGTDDPVNPYKGGEMFVNNASFGVVKSTENTFHYWSALAGYTGEPVKTLLPDTDTTDRKTIEQYCYRQPDKPAITLLKVIGGKHDYPGDIDVYQYVWAFFKSL
jgi:polyhydroxybutyrate depolymerase